MLASLIPIALVVLHWTIVIGLSLRVLITRRSRGSAFAWILLMLAIPYVGAALYLFIGEVWLPRQRVLQIREIVRTGTGGSGSPVTPTMACEVPGIDQGLLALMGTQALNASGMSLTSGNAIESLDGAGPAFDRLLHDIRHARASCHLLFYIWHPGGKTEAIAEALEHAAARGVDCRVLLDAHGSAAFFASPLPGRLRKAGVRVAAACPIGRVRLQLARIDLRNHRKIVVIDSVIGYAGSLNLADPAIFKVKARVGRWVDCAVRLTGPAAARLQAVFLNDWCLEHPSEISAEPETPPASADLAGDSCVQVLPSGPGQDPHVLRQMLLTLLYSARQEVVLTTPYFVPDEATLHTLISLARGGVRVRLIVPERVDAVLVRHASRAYYRDLLEAGVEIMLFQGGLLHSKTATVDGKISLLGSANMDLRSFDLNLEVSLFIFDPGFTAQLRTLQEEYAARSVVVDPAAWSNRPVHRSLLENLAQLLAPIL